MKRKVCVIGGGASGVMAAIVAAKAGASVVILEHRDRILKKILLTGNGKCNLTNLFMDKSAYDTSGDLLLVEQILQAFSEKDLMECMEGLGMRLMTNREFYVYPETESAATVVQVLIRALDYYQISIQTEVHINEIQKKDVFYIKTNIGEYKADRVIFACGGKSFPKTGSDGSGWKLVKKLGVPVIWDYPALTALVSNHKGLKALGGLRANGSVTLYIDGKISAMDKGQIQFTDYGISGIPVFQISAKAVRALLDKKKVTVRINLFPYMKEKELVDALEEQFHRFADYSFEEAMNGFLHKKWIDVVKQHFHLSAYENVAAIPKEKVILLANELSSMEFEIVDKKGYDFCQVTGGGVPLEVVNESLEVISIPGLFVVGEMLDVTGKCGGYNLQWAFSTGYIAGTKSAK